LAMWWGSSRFKSGSKQSGRRMPTFQAPDPMAPVYQGTIDRLPDWARSPAQSGYDAYNAVQHPQIQVPVPKIPEVPNPTIRNGRGCWGLC
jgi:hypothetical protein